MVSVELEDPLGLVRDLLQASLRAEVPLGDGPKRVAGVNRQPLRRFGCCRPRGSSSSSSSSSRIGIPIGVLVGLRRTCGCLLSLGYPRKRSEDSYRQCHYYYCDQQPDKRFLEARAQGSTQGCFPPYLERPSLPKTEGRTARIFEVSLKKGAPLVRRG